MTDRIDLDERAEPTDEQSDDRHRGDWLWRGTGDPESESPDPWGGGDDGGGEEPTDAATPGAETGATDADSTGRDDDRGRAVPHVPRANEDRPVGIPVDGGGSGGGRPRDAEAANGGTAGAEATEDGTEGGPHGRDADDMTLAFTFGAMRRLADPAAVVADAARWADWVGVVGDVDVHVVNKFQRDHRLDLDFFNGSGTGPGERLAEIDHHSMFYADRMVVVGREGEDERVAAEAGWEFVPLRTAAEKADWDVEA